MRIDEVISSNILGTLNLHKDFYALVGASIVVFGKTLHLLSIHLHQNDTNPGIGALEVLGNTARFKRTISKVRDMYQDTEIGNVLADYEKLAIDRNKIAHGVAARIDGVMHYPYVLSNGEQGDLGEDFFFSFIDECNLFMAKITILDDDVKKRYNLFREVGNENITQN